MLGLVTPPVTRTLSTQREQVCGQRLAVAHSLLTLEAFTKCLDHGLGLALPGKLGQRIN